jgi:hydrogenase nickel incorporation protein HypA/HybF
MHELSICQSIIAQLDRIAREHDARVVSFTLQVGPLSGVEAELIERAYLLAAAGTPFSSARLFIDSLPVRVLCRGCREESLVAPNNLVCSHCGSWHTELVSGSELLLASVELERGKLMRSTLN